MIAVLYAALALAGAPASTPVTCYPTPPVSARGVTGWGLTYLHASPVRIDLYGPVACAALWYTGASPSERRAIARLNPAIDFERIVGDGLLVVEHEATHVGLMSADECLVEQTAIARIPGLLASYFDPTFAASALAYATTYDTFEQTALRC